MDELAEKVVETATRVALEPVSGILADAIGYLGGDKLRSLRRKNIDRIAHLAENQLNSRDIKGADEISPSISVPLITAAMDESRDELQEIWARLLAGAADPSRKAGYRREFVGIIKELEPIDAKVLPLSATIGEVPPTRRDRWAEICGVSPNEIDLVFRNLLRLGLIDPPNVVDRTKTPAATALAIQLLTVLGVKTDRTL